MWEWSSLDPTGTVVGGASGGAPGSSRAEGPRLESPCNGIPPAAHSGPAVAVELGASSPVAICTASSS
jgi:hypothetical protein